MDIDVIYDSGYQHKRVKGMPAFACFKGPSGVSQTNSEKQQEKNAVEMNAHFNSVYKPLEESTIAQEKAFTKEKRIGLNAGRGNADIAQQAEDARSANRVAIAASGADLNSDSASAGLRRTEDAVAGAHNQVDREAVNKGQQSQDTSTLNLINSGRDKATRTAAGLRQASSTEASAAQAKLERDTMLSNERTKAYTQVATTAIGGAATRMRDAKPAVTDPNAPAPPTMLAKSSIRSAVPYTPEPQQWRQWTAVPGAQ